MYFLGFNELTPKRSSGINYTHVFAYKNHTKFLILLTVDPYLMTCPLPSSHKNKIPAIVSLVEERCESAKNSLKVIYDRPKDNERKEKFAVCSKSIDFQQDISPKLGKVSLH